MERFTPQIERDEESLSMSIIENVAGHKGTEALMLDPPLYEVLDPDALDALFRGQDGTRRKGKFTFEYCGCMVTVASDGHVLVEDTDETDRESLVE